MPPIKPGRWSVNPGDIDPRWLWGWQGLKAAVIFADQRPFELVHRQTFLLEEGTPGVLPTPDGQGIDIETEITYTLPTAPKYTVDLSSGCAIACGVLITGTPAFPNQFWGITHNNTDSSPFQSLTLGIDSSGFWAFFRNDGTGLQTINHSGITPSIGDFILMVGVVDANGDESFWSFLGDGTFYSDSGNSTASLAYGATSELVIGSQPGTAGRNPQSIFRFGYLWDRGLTESEVRLLAQDPYGLIRPRAQTLPSFSSLYATADQTLFDVVDELDTTINLFDSINDDPDTPTDTDWINNEVTP